jgi:hypothetical protein
MTIPTESILIPEDISFVRLGAGRDGPRHRAGVRGLGIPFAVFLTASFFKRLPDSLMEAALVDGAGHLRVFLRVRAPLAPTLAHCGCAAVPGSVETPAHGLALPAAASADDQRGIASLQGTHVTNTSAMIAGSIPQR